MNRRTTLAVAISALAAAWLPQGPAGAHNVAHFFLPDGSCHEVGSNRDAPIVGAGNPNQVPGSEQRAGQLDLIPGNGDQYGARYAARNPARDYYRQLPLSVTNTTRSRGRQPRLSDRHRRSGHRTVIVRSRSGVH